MYTTKQLASQFGLHPNTIRLYERLGYISPAERGTNRYRYFGDLHMLQMKVCRSIFGYPYFNRRLRGCGNEVIYAAAGRDWDGGEKAVRRYLEKIQDELATAHETEQILKEWVSGSERVSRELPEAVRFSRREAAQWLGVTAETVRNWERNALVVSMAGNDKKRCFERPALEKMRVIYMLRLAGYSMAAVHRSLSAFDRSRDDRSDPVSRLHQPAAEETIMVGDRWVFELNRLAAAAAGLPALFEQMRRFSG